MINKGDIVLVEAETNGKQTGPYHSKRELSTTRYSTPKKGIVIGYSFIRTGNIVAGNGDMYDYEPSYLESIIDNKVWVVELLEKGNRYLKPIRVLDIHIKKL